MGESTQVPGRVIALQNGAVEAATAIGTLRGMGDQAPGAEVMLIVRPENIRTTASDVDLGPARIREATFQGAHYRVLAKSEQGAQDFVLRLPPDHPVEQGMALRLGCRADNLIILNR
jgi:hypothetical protein